MFVVLLRCLWLGLCGFSGRSEAGLPSGGGWFFFGFVFSVLACCYWFCAGISGGVCVRAYVGWLYLEDLINIAIFRCSCVLVSLSFLCLFFNLSGLSNICVGLF